jgi:hypothetical protein
LLAVLIGPLGPAELNDASTLFSIWQRIAGPLGVGLIAALYAQQAAARGPVTALHITGWLVAAISAAGLITAPLLAAERNAAATRPQANAGRIWHCPRSGQLAARLR